MSLSQTITRPQVINNIIIFNSSTPWGTRESIGHEHRQNRGWREIGYHFVIENGYASQDAVFKQEDDGRIVAGRTLKKETETIIKICLVGKHQFSRRQYTCLVRLCHRLQNFYQVSTKSVIGSHEAHEHTTPAPFDMTLFRLLLETSLHPDMKKQQRHHL